MVHGGWEAKVDRLERAAERAQRGEPTSAPHTSATYYDDSLPGVAISILIVFGIIIYALLKTNLLSYLTQTIGTIPVAIISGLLILPLGYCLFVIRERRLMMYARLEILFGITYGIYTIGDKNHWGTLRDSGTSNLATWTALASSLYIVVRGLDNRKKALEARRNIKQPVPKESKAPEEVTTK